VATAARRDKTREFHARGVKISRAARGEANFQSRFIGLFAKKSVGTCGAKQKLKSVLTAGVPSVEFANCHLNKTKT